MTAQHPDATAVVARFAARHDAEIAKSYLADHGIDAFILADDVHVPLQFTDGARLVVMQSEAEEAYQRLEEADSIPDATFASAVFGTGLYVTILPPVALHAGARLYVPLDASNSDGDSGEMRPALGIGVSIRP